MKEGEEKREGGGYKEQWIESDQTLVIISVYVFIFSI